MYCPENDEKNGRAKNHLKQYNGGVDAAARFHSSIVVPIMMRSTLPPLASNDLLYGAQFK